MSKTIFACSACVIGLAFVGGCSSAPAPPADGPTSITTDKGVVEGSIGDGARVWLGIPYAAPPVGPLRFLPPKEAAAWTSPRVADTFGAECSQLNATSPPALVVGSGEDCLYLNVWAPQADVKNAPVFVWIHGGGFTTGSGGEPLYSGENIAAQTGAIVVTINYRLGALGWLSHPDLATEEGVTTSPSQGLLDQQAALQWVQRNIAAFGGDPSNVTLAGESAGAISVCAHLAAPGSRGLFAHAVMESGVCFSSVLFQSPSAANDQGQRLATAVGCADVSCLRTKTPDELLSALPARIAEFGATGDAFGPVIDGPVLPMEPMSAFASGQFTKVPTILGTNLNEGESFLYLFTIHGSPPAATDVRASLALIFTPSEVDQIAARYGIDADPQGAFSQIITDGVFVCPTRRVARALSAAGVATYLYQFTYPYTVPAVPGVVMSHAFELPFVFRNRLLGAQLSDADLALADQVDGYWFRFAATGDPNGASALAWPAYTAGNDTNLVFDATISTNTGLKKDTCDFWDTLTP